ncbi:hypothetical protein O9K51_10914 [Purpureocillium lavendulum]|uniref:SPX domain-containing protein n=1 Tax=Purpureocillium lavendulum TaxID=1247861 RepID=A0AB34FBZ9_9HYPO|nr:hypothetical protein O9K51_10914 [Purpureocillium lavendulum]
MKYGQQLEQESVPEWSLHNLDYNSLKHEIKVHTTRDQASAMAIPGHQDTSLRKFEDGLFDELCNQHDRVDLFVTSKADEISRRLEHLNTSIQRCIAKHSTGQDQSFSLKRQRRFAKYERELMRCGDDIQALSRFANAQIVAFRKILKKYRKWTGSTTLTSRFNDIVLGNSKSFTRRDFSALQTRYDALLSELRSAAPVLSDPGSPSSDEQPLPEPPSPGTARVSFDPFPPTQMGPQVKYWNEYDDGSDAGGPEDDYAIYINPSEDTSFPGMAYVQAIVSMPSVKAKQWFRPRHRGEWRPLLSSANTSQSYSSTAVDSEEEGYASSDGLPYQGYMTHYALPSVSEQRAMRYRERALLWGTVGSFIASFVLLGIAGILTSTGKRKLRVEVDAGVTVGIMRRLSDKERRQIRSGSVFVWDEREAGIRRWTDGKSWSRSRVSGSFLTYVEMDGKNGGGFGGGGRGVSKIPHLAHCSDKDDNDGQLQGYRHDANGLMKLSFSITTLMGQRLHLISYYSRTQLANLQRPSSDPSLRSVLPTKSMYPESSMDDANQMHALRLASMHQPCGWPPSPATRPSYGHNAPAPFPPDVHVLPPPMHSPANSNGNYEHALPHERSLSPVQNSKPSLPPNQRHHVSQIPSPPRLCFSVREKELQAAAQAAPNNQHLGSDPSKGYGPLPSLKTASNAAPATSHAGMAKPPTRNIGASPPRITQDAPATNGHRLCLTVLLNPTQLGSEARDARPPGNNSAGRCNGEFPGDCNIVTFSFTGDEDRLWQIENERHM